MKNAKKVIAVIILLVAAYFYAHVAKKDLLYDKQVDSSEYQGYALMDTTSVTQEFGTREQSLDGFYVKLTTAGDISAVDVTLMLSEKESGEVLAERTIGASTFRSGRFAGFFFDAPAAVSADHTYVITVSARGTDAYNYIAMYYQKGVEPNTKLRIGTEPIDGTMIARAVTYRFDVETCVISLVIVAFMYGFMKLLYKLFR